MFAQLILRFPIFITQYTRNPYLNLSPQQINNQIKKKLMMKENTINHLNSLIKLGIAQHTVLQKQIIPMNKVVIEACISILRQIHDNKSQVQEENAQNIEFGMLCELLECNSDKRLNIIFSQILKYYQNTYLHILPFQIHLQIYETCKSAYEKIQLDTSTSIFDMEKNQTTKLQSLEHLIQLSKATVNHRIGYADISLPTYIKYCRYFNRQFDKYKFINKMKFYKMKETDCLELSEMEKSTICYIASTLLDIKEYQSCIWSQLQPNYLLVGVSNQKQLCFKLQLMKYKKIVYVDQIENFPFQQLEWDFDHIVWISEFIKDLYPKSSKYTQICTTFHKLLTSTSITINSSSFAVIQYIAHLEPSITSQTHQAISIWMSSQNLKAQNPKTLCELIISIDKCQWNPYYSTLLKAILKLSLGGFEWEQQNIVYYHGIVWKIEDENMEYLRRYILNGYASLGVSRRDIPTSSYFYKILGVTNTQQFYGIL